MNKQPVTSTSLAAVGFDSGTQTLHVEFQNARAYRYYGVPRAIFEELAEAESKGRFFNARIRNHYPYRLVAGAPARPVWVRCALCGDMKQARRA